MVDRALDSQTVTRLRRILREKIDEARPKFKTIYNGSRQRPLLEITQRNEKRFVPLPSSETQTNTREF